MKLLVFGKSGQVAQELAKIAPDARFLPRDEADLRDPAGCAEIIARSGAEAVINAAAYTAVDKAEGEVEIAEIVNAAAPTAMAQAAAALGIPFVHISTDYVFAGTGTAPWAADSPVNPQSVYGQSKLAGERGVQAAGGVYAILRTSWVVSAHGKNFVKTMLRLGQTRDSLTVVGDQIGGPTPAAAVAGATLHMAKTLVKNGGPSGVYHLSGAPDVSWAGFAREIFAQAGLAVQLRDIPTSDYPTPATRPLNSRLDCQSLLQDFGIARPDWRLGLQEILKDVKEQADE
jgi:dTDP-4-dehydrorhamnose reductase